MRSVGMDEATNLPGTFPGHRYWKTIQGSVDAILAPMGIKRRVVSMGTQFCNYDAWTWIAFCDELCAAMAKHPGQSPTSDEVKDMVRKASAARCRDPHIRVARMPARVTHRIALAISGGGYHEAWHTKYSKRDRVRMSEVADIVDMIDEVTLAGGQFDAKMRGLLSTLQHLIEDIRIERRGNEDFPGAIQPMRDLQDFILDLEAKGRAKGAKVKNITVSTNARSILLCAMRDLGLGYNTHKSRAALDYYKETAPGAVALLAPGGLLAPFVHEAKMLGADDKMGSLRVAMKIVVALWRATQTQEDDETNEKPQACCPNCGAGPSELVIRSVRNEQGVKVHGRAELECRACGFKHEFDLPDNSLNLNQNLPEQDPGAEQPEIEDLDAEDVGEGSDGFGHDDREKMRDVSRPRRKTTPEDAGAREEKEGPGDEDAETQEEKDEVSGEGDGFDELDERDGIDGPDEEACGSDGERENTVGSDSMDGEEDAQPTSDSTDGDEEGEDSRVLATMPVRGDEAREDVPCLPGAGGSGRQEEKGAKSEDGEAGEGDEGEDDGVAPCSTAPDWHGADENWEMGAEEFLARYVGSPGAGGFFDLGQDPESMFERAEQVFAGTDADGVMNNMAGLELAMQAESRGEFRDLEPGEMAWNPYNPMLDEARVVRSASVDRDRERANEMLAEVRETVTFLRARLRSIVRAQEMTNTAHGVRRGRKLSNRRITDTGIELLGNQNPSRPYQITDTSIDTSVALCIVLDQSGSMSNSLRAVAQAMMVMADCVESVKGKTMAFGFRDGVDTRYDGPRSYAATYHRVHGVRYDVFKTWEESFMNAKWRFAHTQADGGTPMADGVQYGLTALNERREAHRILWVITDGCPNYPHEKVIARQIRLAKDAGIHVIGCGIGSGAKYVQSLFPDHVWVRKVRDLPQPTVAKLNELCDFSGRYRGRRAKLDGTISRKVS